MAQNQGNPVAGGLLILLVMERLFLDTRVALRRLRARPGFTSIAILSLGLGIGAVTVFFSLMNASLLKPLAVEHPEQIVSPSVTRWSAPAVSYPAYLDIRDRSNTFAAVTTYRMAPMSMSLGGGRNSRVWGYLADANFFTMLGVKAALGRTFLPEEDGRAEGAHPVAVLTYLGWQKRFAGAPDALGRAIRLNGMDYRIVGILAPEFNGIERFFGAEIYVPMMMQPQIEPGNAMLKNRDEKSIFLLARLRPDVPRAESERRLNAFAAELGRQYPATDAGIEFRLAEAGWAGDYLRGTALGFNAALMGIGALLLLVVCINLAGLQLARASERRRETALQLAIGARRGQVASAWIVECVLLATAGGLAGLLLAQWAADAITALQPPVDFGLRTAVTLDYRVMAFAALITIAATLAMGLAPAFNSIRVDVNAALKGDEDGAKGRRRRWSGRDLLVATQVAASVLILGAASVVVSSLRGAVTLRPGFDPRGAAAIAFDLGMQGFDRARGAAFQNRLLERVRAESGIAAAGIINVLPLDPDVSNSDVGDASQPPPPPGKELSSQVYRAWPGLFAALGTPLVAGREFRDSDATGARVVIVNRAFGSWLFPGSGGDVVGRQVRFYGEKHEVVGVVEDAKYLSVSEAKRPVIFAPGNRYYSDGTRLVARWGGDANALAARLRQIALELEPDLVIHKSIALEEQIAFSSLPAKLVGSTLVVFGCMTLFLAAIGIYGVASFAVLRRTREIGIRMAIGAEPKQVLRTVFGRTGWMLMAGATAGLALALAARGQLAPLLLESTPPGMVPVFAGLAVIGLVVLLAAWFPARRAISIAPSQALRHD